MRLVLHKGRSLLQAEACVLMDKYGADIQEYIQKIVNHVWVASLAGVHVWVASLAGV